MDHCVVHRGKRKQLVDDTKPHHRMSEVEKRILQYKKYVRNFEYRVEQALAILCEDPLKELHDFIQTGWLCESEGSIPTGIVQFRVCDGIDLVGILSLSLNEQLVVIEVPLSPVYSIVETLRKNTEAKCLLLNQLETIPGSFLDDLIMVIADHDWSIPTVIVITMAGNLSSLYSRCSYRTYCQLSLKEFYFPSPKAILDAISNVVTFDLSAEFVIDGSLLELIRKNFLDTTFSVGEVKKLVRLAILRHCMESSDFDREYKDCRDCLERYAAFLGILFEISSSFSGRPETIYDLHVAIQNDSDFFTQNQPFSIWRSIWLTWNVDEMTEALGKIVVFTRKYDDSLTRCAEKLMNDLQHVEDRRNSVRSCVDPANNSENTSSKRAIRSSLYKVTRMTHEDMQRRLKEKIARTKQNDVLTGDRQTFVNLLSKIFAGALRPFSAISELNVRLICGSPEFADLIFPFVNATLESAISLHRDTGSADMKGKQLDLCVAYRTVQRLWNCGKRISLNAWMKLFCDGIADIGDVTCVDRFFRCVCELEMIGVVKVFGNDSKSLTVSLLQVPTTVVC